LAAIAFGIPTKRRTSGRKTGNTETITLPHKLRIPPIITIEKINVTSIP
jgi:hypothetical protein